MDVAGASDFGHGGVVRLDIFEAHRTGVAGDVIRAGEDHNNFGLQVDNILAEADQHLRRGLASDATVDVRLASKILVEMPDVGDGVAEEDDAALAGRGLLQSGVGVAVAREFTAAWPLSIRGISAGLDPARVGRVAGPRR